jgi:rfaE bifunctional protein nucleotidyltransferase chain/domain
MQFIRKTIEEDSICTNSQNYSRKNSPKVDYVNKINEKPWGKEYLAYQNDEIGIWILHVDKDQETSLHCHFKKDTILMPISGCFKINLFKGYKILNILEYIYVPRNTFHGIHSYSDNSVLMEIEIYTEHIQYTDKNDLLRIRDIYNRDKNNYESSVVERNPYENETMILQSPNNYMLYGTEVSILTLESFDEIKSKYDCVILLEGKLYSEGKKISPGSFINTNSESSFLTDKITVICFYNINKPYLKKIIYSKTHLKDFLKANLFGKIGLTSGCFDIIHEGHIHNLKLCKNNCNTLFVCLSSDTQIKRLKGTTRPINHLDDRIKMLINFDFIDFIILYEEQDDVREIELDNIMNLVNPDTWFKGSDYKKEQILEKHPGLRNIQIISLIEGKSTTNIIKNIQSTQST